MHSIIVLLIGLGAGFAFALLLEGFAEMYTRLKRYRLEAKWQRERIDRDAHHTCRRLRP